MAKDIMIEIYSDYIWPYCYLGMGLVDKLKERYNIKTKWKTLEIHPETPSSGVNLAERFGSDNLNASLKNLRTRGVPLGIEFGTLENMPNSNLAHQLSILAKEESTFDTIHHKLMDAYFKYSLDIGNKEVLLDIAEESGMDKILVNNTLNSNSLKEEVDKLSKEGHTKGINSTPTFIINDAYIINGAQDISIFEKIIEEIGDEN